MDDQTHNAIVDDAGRTVRSRPAGLYGELPPLPAPTAAGSASAPRQRTNMPALD